MSHSADVLHHSSVPAKGAAKVRQWAAFRQKFSDFAAGALVPALLLIVWQLAGNLGLISTFFLPTPLMIAEAFKNLTVTGELSGHLGISVSRAASGFAAGGTLGLLLGIAAGYFRRVEQVFDPTLQMIRLVPHLAIAPLVILWFGFGETSKMVIIASGAFFPLYINTFLGIRSVDNKLFEVSQVLQFSRYKQMVRVILPSSLPQILIGLRLSLAVSWLGLVVAELIGSQSGIGFLINFAKQNSTTEVIFVGVLLFAVVGKIVDSFVRILEHRLLQWRDSYEG
ncbi:ABC transporter permease [Paenibacillus lutrae]|uniref:ABC transporter permease subunit n=1 Tax=Paenibacillus lutrae TaxID=2078573 RepID=A0A7X3FKI1_9BACL|nr:ABC transporter permease [Paenibacillus lutrae]MVP01393.1 ABC transporter permease subunit [Paenibacillus lutrae]